MGTSRPVEIKSPAGTLRGKIHAADGARTAVIMVGGAGGGLHGPSGVYEPLANRLRAAGTTALRLEYRHPNVLEECVYDVHAAVDALSRQGIERVVLIGWSFGGAVVIGAGVELGEVVGVATVASQTYGADAVSRLSPKAILLLHGTGDRVLPDRCSRELYAKAGEPRELVLYPKDDHGLSVHATEMLEKLFTWSTQVLNRQTAGTQAP